MADKKTTMKVLLGVVGGAAVIVLGVASMAAGQQSATLAVHLPPPAPTATQGNMRVGATITTTTPEPVEATTMARPVIKGTPALPSEDAGLP